MKFKPFPLPEVYRLIEPGPVVMVTTSSGGRDNVMTMAWHTMIEFTPALIGCVISNRNYSLDLLRSSKQCVIAIPDADMARIALKVGSVSGRRIDKFESFGLTKLKATKVQAPLIAECFANLECVIHDSSLVDEYNFFILKVVKAWLNPSAKNRKTLHHSGTGLFVIDGKKIKLPWKLK